MTMTQERQLLARIDELVETIRQLRKPVPPTHLLPHSWGLTPRERDLLAVLFMSRLTYTHRDVLMEAMYADRDHEANEKIVDVWICKMRKKLKPLGMKIESRRGLGYRIPEETKQIIRNSMLPDGRSS
jgi:two-component system, cell cycle response regulator CtrA